MEDNTQCQIGQHCGGRGQIAVHVVHWKLLACLECASGSPFEILVDTTRQSLTPENYGRIHSAESLAHECEFMNN